VHTVYCIKMFEIFVQTGNKKIKTDEYYSQSGLYSHTVLYGHIHQTLVNTLHGLPNFEIGGLDCRVIIYISV